MNLPTFGFLPTHLLDSLGWAVLHCFWQGLIAMLVIMVFRLCTPDRYAALRYNFEVLCLAGCFIAFLLTFRCYYTTGIESFPLSVVPAVTPISGANELGLDSVKHEQLAIATATFDIYK